MRLHDRACLRLCVYVATSRFLYFCSKLSMSAYHVVNFSTVMRVAAGVVSVCSNLSHTHMVQERLEFGGCKHSGDWYGKIRSSEFKKGSDVRETIEINLAEVRGLKIAYVVVGVFSWGGQDMSEIPRAFTYVANPAVRGSGPGGA